MLKTIKFGVASIYCGAYIFLDKQAFSSFFIATPIAASAALYTGWHIVPPLATWIGEKVQFADPVGMFLPYIFSIIMASPVLLAVFGVTEYGLITLFKNLLASQ